MGDNRLQEVTGLMKVLEEGQPKKKEKAASRLVDLTCYENMRVGVCQTKGFLDLMVRLLVTGAMTIKEKVAAALGNLALENGNVARIAHHPDMLKTLVSVFYTNGSAKAQENVARTLGNLGNGNDDILLKLSQIKGAVQAVVALATNGTTLGREHAAAILWDMAQAEIVAPGVPGVSEGLVSVLKDGTPTAKENASGALCSLFLLEPEECTALLEVPDTLPACVGALKDEGVPCQESVSELLWIMMSNGCAKEVAAHPGTIPALAGCLGSESAGVVESCTACLRSVCSLGAEHCTTLVGIPDALASLVKNMRMANIPVREDGAGAVWNLAFHDALRLKVAATPGLVDAFKFIVEDHSEGDDRGPVANVAGALRMLSVEQDNTTQLLAHNKDCFVLLARVLAHDIESAKEDASAALWNLSCCLEDKVVACEVPNLLSGLVAVCLEGSNEARQNAAGALGALALSLQSAEMIAATPRSLDALVGLLSVDDAACKEHAAAALGNLAMESEANMALIAKHPGALEGLVSVIRYGEDSAKENAVAALGNLALNSSNMELIAKPGAMEALGALLVGGTDKGKENSALTLGNLVLNSQANADLLVSTPGLLDGLVALVAGGTPHAQENAALALSHVAVHASSEEALVGHKACLPSLVGLLKAGSPVGREDAAACLGNLALRSQENMERVGACEGAVDALVALARDGTDEAKENALLALGNLSLHASNEARIAASPSCFQVLAQSVASGTPVSKDGAAKVVANLSASNVECNKQLGKVDNLVGDLVRLLELEECQQSATAALLNLSSVERNRMLIAKAKDVRALLEAVSLQDGPESAQALQVLKKLPDFKEAAAAAAKRKAPPPRLRHGARPMSMIMVSTKGLSKKEGQQDPTPVAHTPRGSSAHAANPMLERPHDSNVNVPGGLVRRMSMGALLLPKGQLQLNLDPDDDKRKDQSNRTARKSVRGAHPSHRTKKGAALTAKDLDDEQESDEE